METFKLTLNQFREHVTRLARQDGISEVSEDMLIGDLKTLVAAYGLLDSSRRVTVVVEIDVPDPGEVL